MRTMTSRAGCHLRAILSIALIGSLVLAIPCLAEPPADDSSPGAGGPKAVPGGHKVKEEQENRQARRGDMRKRMLEKFDKDQDGRLSNEEREALREFMQKRRTEPGDRFGRGGDFRRGPGAGGPQGGHAAPRSAKGKRPRGPVFGGPGPDGPPAGPPRKGRPSRERKGYREFGGDRPKHLGQVHGSQGAGGHVGPPNLGQLFNRMDQDEDGKLDKKEFKAGMKHLREMHRPDNAARARGGSDGPRHGHSRQGRGGDDFRPGPPDGDGPRFHGDRRPHPDRRIGGPGKKDRPGEARPRRRKRPEARPDETKPFEQDADDSPTVE